MSKAEIMIDQYLKPGVPCEVWNQADKPELPDIARFVKVSGSGHNVFSIQGFVSVWNHYRPIGTPWDHVPTCVETISICDAFGYWESSDGSRVPWVGRWVQMPQSFETGKYNRPDWAKEDKVVSY